MSVRISKASRIANKNETKKGIQNESAATAGLTAQQALEYGGYAALTAAGLYTGYRAGAAVKSTIDSAFDFPGNAYRYVRDTAVEGAQRAYEGSRDAVYAGAGAVRDAGLAAGGAAIDAGLAAGGAVRDAGGAAIDAGLAAGVAVRDGAVHTAMLPQAGRLAVTDAAGAGIRGAAQEFAFSDAALSQVENAQRAVQNEMFPNNIDFGQSRGEFRGFDASYTSKDLRMSPDGYFGSIPGTQFSTTWMPDTADYRLLSMQGVPSLF